MLSVPLILEGLLGIPFKGDVPMIVAAASLLIVGYLALGALLQLLVRDLATGLGLTGLVVSPAFGYAGVGFPTFGMNAFAQAWSAILPLRWYMAVLLGQAARGLPLSDSAAPVRGAGGAGGALLRCLRCCACARSRASAGSRRRRLPSRRRDAARAARHRRRLRSRVAARARRRAAPSSCWSLAPLVYGIYYPQPYLNQILRKIPIAVVDNDLSDLSRRIVQTLDASGAVKRGGPRRHACRGARRARPRRGLRRRRHPARHRARRAQGHHRSHSDLRRCHLPVHLQDHGKRHRRRDQHAVLRARCAAARAPTAAWSRRRSRASSPADILLQPIFNPVGGYASYIVPAAFVLILQQTAADRRGDADRWSRWRSRPAEHSRACSAAASPT